MEVSHGLPTSLKTKLLTESDRKVLEMKYKSVKIKKMTDRQLNAHVLALMMKVSVITGWQIPQFDSSEGKKENPYAMILQDQFRKKMMEDYGDLNIDEIEYALRSFGTKIKDWGKAMNLSLIDEAIGKYTFLRREISEYEENVKVNLPSLNAGNADWSDVWERLKENPENKSLITTALYDWLDRTGKIKLDKKEKHSLIERARQKLIVEMKYKIMNGEPKYKKDLEELESDKLTKLTKAKIINRAKHIAVIELIDNLKLY